MALSGNGQALARRDHALTRQLHTWDEILTEMARALGETPQPVEVASDTLVRYEPAWKGPLHGDKAPSTLFDTSKVSSVAGPFSTTMGFAAAAVEVRRRLERGAERAGQRGLPLDVDQALTHAALMLPHPARSAPTSPDPRCARMGR